MGEEETVNGIDQVPSDLGQAATLAVVQPELAALELLLEDSVLLEELLDRSRLLAVHPAREGKQQGLEGEVAGRHRVIVATHKS